MVKKGDHVTHSQQVGHGPIRYRPATCNLLLLQAFFWTIFRQFNSTGVAGFWVFFGILAWVFSRFCLSFEFFHEFFGIFKKVQIFSNFWKYLMIKRLFLGVPLSFSPKNWVFIQFSNNSTQLELPVFEFFRSFAWVFSRFSLSFEFFGAWVFFEMSKKSLIYYYVNM